MAVRLRSLEPVPFITKISLRRESTSASVRDGSAAAPASTPYTVACPRPILPWGSSPERYETATPISSASSDRSMSARTSRFRMRDLVAPTAADAATSFESSKVSPPDRTASLGAE